MQEKKVKVLVESIKRTNQPNYFKQTNIQRELGKFEKETTFTFHKTVLLHERKRHTACRVANTASAVLSGGGTPSLARRYPILAGGVPHPWLEGTPSWLGGTPFLGYPTCLGLRYLHVCDWGPPRKGPGTSHLGTPHKDMGPVEVLWDRDGVTPQSVDRHTPVKFYLPVILRTRAVINLIN